MVVLDKETLKAIEKKAKLYDAAKDRIISRIRGNIAIAIEKLKATEKELLSEMEIEFDENPFSEFLGYDNHTDEEVKAILEKEVPYDFGPGEEAFCSLCKEIESFKTWRKEKEEEEEEKKTSPFDLIPKNLKCTNVTSDTISLLWDDVNCDCFYEVEVKSLPTVQNIYHSFESKLTLCEVKPETEYYVRVRSVISNECERCIWSNPISIKTRSKNPLWKECPDNVDFSREYTLDVANPRIAIKAGSDNSYCTIIGSTSLPPNKVVSWSIKILQSWGNDGWGILIGVAPFDIDQNENDNYNKSGWYFYCCDSTLWSGPPHNCRGKEYGPRRGEGKYVHMGDSVGVVMDTTKGKLSFVVNGVNLGVAYEGIPLDKPLVPCVILREQGDSVELDFTKVRENVDSSVPVPSNIIAKGGITWDSITLTWDAVEGASFYQVEIDENRQIKLSATNTFTKSLLLSDTEHSFRVRAVKENSVSEWSSAVKGRAEKEFFEMSAWKGCPDPVDWERKYIVNEGNSRITTKIGDEYCTIIGNTPLPPNKVTLWSIKILKSRSNGSGIFIGVAPFGINQNEDDNYNKSGWYFYCYNSTLYSGPPHNYRDKVYGPRKKSRRICSHRRQYWCYYGH